MSLLPFRASSYPGKPRHWLALMSAALACLFVACLVAEEVDAQKRGFGGGGYRPPFRGGFGRGLNGGYGGFRQTPRFTPPPARGGGGFGRRSTAPPPMMPRQPIPRSGGFAPQPRPLPKPVSPKAPVTSLKGFSGQTTKAGSPIVRTSQGKRFAVPQKGISTSLRGQLLKSTALKGGYVNSAVPQKIRTLAIKEHPSQPNTVSVKGKDVTFTDRQIQKKFKHARDFGIKENYSKDNSEKFKQAITEHLNDANTIQINGSYRGKQVTHFLNPKSGLLVIRASNGSFISGWKLNEAQLKHVIGTGNLGGG